MISEPKTEKLPTVLPAKLKELQKHLTEIDEVGGERANQFAVTALVHFFTSLGFKNQVLFRMEKEQTEIESLKESLRKADKAKDPLWGTLIAISGVLSFLEQLGIPASSRLEQLEKAFFKVAHGHQPPEWFKPNIPSRTHTQ